MKCKFCAGKLQSIKSIIFGSTDDVEFFCPVCGQCYDKDYNFLDYKLLKLNNPEYLQK